MNSLKKGDWQSEESHVEKYGHNFKNTKMFRLNHLPYLDLMFNFSKQFPPGFLDIYEFGVYSGGSLKDIINHMDKKEIRFNTAWGFDSFEGLPKEAEGMQKEGPHWNEGAFSIADALKIWNWEELKPYILKTIDSKKVKLIKGYYENVLNADLFFKNNFKPAIFVNIDVDLYKSTIECLDWMIKHKLIIEGTIIRYDDVLKIPENTGELQAHKEIMEKYNIVCKRLTKQYYQVVKVGN